METPFTPGPWEIGNCGVIDSRGVRVADTYPQHPGPNNARLIAAAPAMYEALKEAIGLIEIFHGSAGWEIYRDQSPEMKRLFAALPKFD